MNAIRKALLAIALPAGLLAASQAAAQEYPQGPFDSVNALVNTWNQFAPSQAASVYVDGSLVYRRYGFGPAAGASYFVCPQDAMIRMNCPSSGPFRTQQAIIDYWRQVDPYGMMRIYVNGQLVYSQQGLGPGHSKAYVGCPQRPGGGFMQQCN